MEVWRVGSGIEQPPPPNNHRADLFHTHLLAEWVIKYQEVSFRLTSNLPRYSAPAYVIEFDTKRELDFKIKVLRIRLLICILVGLSVAVLKVFSTTIEAVIAMESKI